MNGLMLSISGWVVYSRENGKIQTVWDEAFGQRWKTEQGSYLHNIDGTRDPVHLPEEYLL